MWTRAKLMFVADSFVLPLLSFHLALPFSFFCFLIDVHPRDVDYKFFFTFFSFTLGLSLGVLPYVLPFVLPLVLPFVLPWVLLTLGLILGLF